MIIRTLTIVLLLTFVMCAGVFAFAAESTLPQAPKIPLTKYKFHCYSKALEIHGSFVINSSYNVNDNNPVPLYISKVMVNDYNNPNIPPRGFTPDLETMKIDHNNSLTITLKDERNYIEIELNNFNHDLDYPNSKFGLIVETQLNLNNKELKFVSSVPTNSNTPFEFYTNTAKTYFESSQYLIENENGTFLTKLENSNDSHCKVSRSMF